MLTGVLIEPAIFGLLDLANLGNQTLILEEAALVTLGIALVGVALRLPVPGREKRRGPPGAFGGLCGRFSRLWRALTG